LVEYHIGAESIFNRFRDIWPPYPVRTDTQTDRHTPQVTLYSVPCNPMQCIALDRQKVKNNRLRDRCKWAWYLEI